MDFGDFGRGYGAFMGLLGLLMGKTSGEYLARTQGRIIDVRSVESAKEISKIGFLKKKR